MLLTKLAENHNRKYAKCKDTGLRMCNVLPNIWIRADGMYKSARNVWRCGYPTCVIKTTHHHPVQIMSYQLPTTGRRTTISIAQMVAFAFIKRYKTITDTVYCVHKDEDYTNNSVENLMVCTKSQMREECAMLKGRVSCVYELKHRTTHSKITNRKNWIISISKNGKTRVIGTFVKYEDAVKHRNIYFKERNKITHQLHGQ